MNYHSSVASAVKEAAQKAKDAEENKYKKPTLNHTLDMEDLSVQMWYALENERFYREKSKLYHRGNRTDSNSTETIKESLKNSLLSFLDVGASEIEMKEAFCRDIDAFNTAFSVSFSKRLTTRLTGSTWVSFSFLLYLTFDWQLENSLNLD